MIRLIVMLEAAEIAKTTEKGISEVIGKAPLERKKSSGQISLTFEIEDNAKAIALMTDLRSRRFKGYIGALNKTI